MASGLCECGCGQTTKLAKDTNGPRGHVKGQPIRFIHGHHGRKAVRWVHRDTGFETPCWIWQLHTTKDGHGRVTLPDGRFVMAHRATWEERRGPLDPAVHLHHLCEQPACVNPDHLTPLTPAEHRQAHARLTVEIVREIRRTYAECDVTYQALADQFGVSLTMAWQIVQHQTWRNV